MRFSLSKKLKKDGKNHMKKLTKLLSLTLVLALVLSLTACAGLGGAKASIEGTWKYNMDVMKMMEASGEMDDMFGEDSGMTEEQMQDLVKVFKKLFDGVDLTMVLDLKEDKTFTLAMDETAAKSAGEKLAERMPEIMPELIAAMFGGQDALNEMMEEYDMTMDDITSLFGDEFNAEDLLEGLEDASVKGSYTYDNGKLVLSSEDSDDEPATLTVELSAEELKVTAIDSANADEEELEMFKSLLPVVFVR